MNKILSFLKQLAIFLFITIALLEISSYAYIRFINPHIPLPTYSIVNAGSKFWVYINEHFGVWHAPNSEYLHNKSCFVVKYTANSHGMRDKERLMNSNDTRVAILGDSFVEGWGNESEDRLSDRLEANLGKEVLNFGTSGGFGTIQEWQLYKHMVREFDHDVVILGILPHNDFKDNDYEIGIKGGAYRPYLDGTYPDYDLVYSAKELPNINKKTPFLKSFDFTLREWSSFYRIMRYLGSYRLEGLTLVPRWQEEFDREKPESRYYNFTNEEWNIMRYSLEQIAEEARDKKLIVFTIPVLPDFEMYTGQEPPLSKKIRELSEEKGFTYVDMLKEFHEQKLNAHDVFFVCDNHWNPFGNEAAASVLAPIVDRALRSKPSQ
ncbi:MAG: hypothetical protein CL942_06140 [Desulfovibrio sp.]|mgnify:CR=1 FL=1|nr:hypothetical protein [Desulfovibrio sp.]|tara:strand:- start:16888 stop:18021 length:1134 start_codon:yes stop_codon:yes gene_type:complete